MSKTRIERRRRIVPLHQGNYEAELVDLMNQAMAARRAEVAEEAEAAEAAGPPLRAGQRAASKRPKKSLQIALQHDELLTESEQTAVKVPVWAIGHDEWSQLADDHPPREDIPEDKEAGVAAKTFPDDRLRGVNAKTFPPELLKVALVEPAIDEATGLYLQRPPLDELLAEGAKILRELSLSRIHYVKLETEAWNVNVGDDSYPKFSLVSLLTGETDDESGRQSASA